MQAAAIELLEFNNFQIQTLGDAQVRLVDTSENMDVLVLNKFHDCIGREVVIMKNEPTKENPLTHTTFWCFMSYYSHHTTGHGFHCGSDHCRGSPLWQQWAGQYYLPHMSMMAAQPHHHHHNNHQKFID